MEPLIVVDRSEVLPVKLGELRKALAGLAEFVEANEPRPLAYNVYLSDEGAHVTVVQVHPDAASIEEHLRVAGAAFPQFAALLRLVSIDVYGAPTPAVLDALGRKARLLGTAALRVHARQAGFVRAGANA